MITALFYACIQEHLSIYTTETILALEHFEL